MVVWSPPTGNRRSIAMVTRGHVHLAPNNRADTGFNRGFVELEGTEKVTVICYRHGGHSKAGNLSSKVRNPDRGIEQRVVGVEMEVDEWRHFGSSDHGVMIARPASRRSPERMHVSEWSLMAHSQPSRAAINSEIVNDQIERKCRPIQRIILKDDRSDNLSITNIRYFYLKT